MLIPGLSSRPRSRCAPQHVLYDGAWFMLLPLPGFLPATLGLPYNAFSLA
jgi:hypothetical protein